VAGPGETVERFGRPFRHFPVAVAAGTHALAWARQEDAPQGAVVVVDREINALGRIGHPWEADPATTLALAMVVRPPLSVEQADAVWLAGGTGTAVGAEAVSGRSLATWWPDEVVARETRQPVASVKAEVLLGPGTVKGAVVTVRLDLAALGLEAGRRDELLEAVLTGLDGACSGLAAGAEETVAAYDAACGLLGLRVKIALLPKGETRGTARHVDRMARLELSSPSGMVDRVSIDQLRSLEVVGP